MTALKDLLMHTQRVTGTHKPITIVHPDKIDQFFEWLKTAPIRLQDKALIAIMLSGGLRVSETLALRKRDFDFKEGFFRLRVLKKRKKIQKTKTVDGKEETYFLTTHKVYRDAKLHPEAVKIVQEYIDFYGIRHHDRLFPMKRNAAYKHVKRIFGRHSCTHSMRHTHASWLLNTMQVPLATAADVMKITPDKLACYNHADVKATLSKLLNRKN
jgi:integrase